MVPGLWLPRSLLLVQRTGRTDGEVRHAAPISAMVDRLIGMDREKKRMAATQWKSFAMAAACVMLPGGMAIAQYAPVDPMPMGQTGMGTMANKISGDIAGGKTGKGGSVAISSRCLADSGPGPERRAMEAEYKRRLASSGKASADSWRAAHGRTYRAGLVAAGKCPASVARR